MQPPERHLLIGQALDRLVALGRASEFQRLAFHVLKRRYPDLVLSELSHDGGEDAFALPAVGASASTPSLACFCHDCDDLLRAAPVTIRAAAVLALSDFPRDELEVSLFRGLFGPRNPMEPPELDALTAEQQAALRGLVLTARDVMGPTATYVRDFHYSLATLLGSFGDPSDIEALLAWAREDAAERRRLVAARASGGVERARRLLPVLVQSQHMRELAGLLGACQAPPAEALLVDLLRGTDPSVWWYHELVAAVGAYRTATATAALLEVLDAALSPATNAAPARGWDALVQEFGQLGREDPKVLSLLHGRARGAVDPAGRDLLAAILRAIGGDAAALVACDLLLDVGPHPIPFGVSELVRDARTAGSTLRAADVRPRAA